MQFPPENSNTKTTRGATAPHRFESARVEGRHRKENGSGWTRAQKASPRTPPGVKDPNAAPWAQDPDNDPQTRLVLESVQTESSIDPKFGPRSGRGCETGPD